MVLAVDVDFARREERAALLLHDVRARKPYKNKARPPLMSSTCGFCLARPLSEAVGGSFPPFLLHQVYRRAGPDCGPPAAPQRPSAGRRGSLRGPPGAPQRGGPTAGASAGDGRRCRSPRSASSARQRGGRAGRERGVRRRSCGSAAGVGGSGTPLPAPRSAVQRGGGERLRHRCPPRAAPPAMDLSLRLLLASCLSLGAAGEFDRR